MVVYLIQVAVFHTLVRFRVCFEQENPWHSGNYEVWILSESGTWHDKKISQKHCTDKYL